MSQNTRRAIRLDLTDGPEMEIPAPVAGEFDVIPAWCLDNEGREDTRRRVVVRFQLGSDEHMLSLHPADAKALYEALHDALHVVQVAQKPPREHWSRR